MWQHTCAGLTHPLPILHDLGRFPCFHSSQATRTLFLLKARQVPSLHFSKPYNDTLLTWNKINWPFTIHLLFYPLVSDSTGPLAVLQIQQGLSCLPVVEAFSSIRNTFPPQISLSTDPLLPTVSTFTLSRYPPLLALHKIALLHHVL